MQKRTSHLSKLLRVITNSERSEFACKRRWWFSHVEGLATDAAAPLRLGSLWHHCLAAWYRSQCMMTAADIEQAVIQPWVESRNAWHELHPENVDAQEEDREGAITIRGMLKNYIIEFASDAHDFRVLHVEPQVARWLYHPKTGKPLRDRILLKNKKTFRQWLYGGALDLIVQFKDGSIWFMEHKTTIEKDLGNYVRKLDWDPQIRGYAWALMDPALDADSPIREPIRVEGVIYNVARKKVPQEPGVLVKGGLSKSKDIDTTRDLYMAAIQRHGLNPDAYADVLEQLRGKSFFKREHVVFTDPELDDFEKEATHAALEIMAAEHADYHPRQQSVCTGIAAHPCQFKQICLTDGPMMRKSFVVRGIRHAELTGNLAEDYVAKMRQVTKKPKDEAPKQSILEKQLIESLEKPVQQENSLAKETASVYEESRVLYTIDPFADDVAG